MIEPPGKSLASWGTFKGAAEAGLVGGVAGEITGGKFDDGFSVSAAGYLFNAAAHAKQPMQISDVGLQAIADREGFSPTIYQDVAGNDTIGYGHMLAPGETAIYQNGITQDQALALLKQDVQATAQAVNSFVRVSLSQGQFDALVSFTYNAGVSNFSGSTLLRLLNSGDYAGAADQLLRWNHATINGQSTIVPGLTNRRTAERCQFLSNC
ncbi:MAG: lysozyme [Steroidobacteraceae bacterium]